MLSLLIFLRNHKINKILLNQLDFELNYISSKYIETPFIEREFKLIYDNPNNRGLSFDCWKIVRASDISEIERIDVIESIIEYIGLHKDEIIEIIEQNNKYELDMIKVLRGART